MEFPENLKYTKDDTWIRVEGEKATIGITAFALGQMGDILQLEMPQIGVSIRRSAVMGSFESLTTLRDLFAPVSGQVIAVNTDLPAHPSQINEEPYGSGWMVTLKITDPSELGTLLDAGQYSSMLSSYTN